MKFFKKFWVKIKKKIPGKLPKWAIVSIVIGIILVLGLGAFFVCGALLGDDTVQKINTYTVARGNVEVTITGSGSIEPNDQYNITPLVRGEILSSDFEEGDIVEKGDIMYVIDSSDQESTMKKAQNSLKQAQSSYNEAVKDYNNLTVKSPITGTVTAVYVEEGDSVNTNTKVMDIINDEYMILTIPFIAQDAKTIYTGQKATVNVEGSRYTVDGVVTYVTSGSTLNAEGVQVSTVEIQVKNPGALEAGDKATAIVGSVACNAAGTFKISKTVSIMAEASGEVIKLPVRAGDNVSKGETVMKIDSSSVEKQVENAEINLESAQISYENTLDQMENYTITAPISGTVIQKNSKAGDTIDSSTSQVTMAVIADMSRMTFDISIDELDIQMLEVGQKATVTADAFEGQIFTGTVDYISVIGTTANGVTTYPVTIALDDPGDLLPGMNVDATIVVDSSENTLIVPVDAVQRNNIVYVKDDGTTQQPEKTVENEMDGKMPKMPMRNVPEGFKAVRVTLGINNDSYIEILDGLKEGDVVYVQARAASLGNPMTSFPGGMGGGMPSGNRMPSGGMPSGNRMPGGGMPSGGGMSGGGGMMR